MSRRMATDSQIRGDKCSYWTPLSTSTNRAIDNAGIWIVYCFIVAVLDVRLRLPYGPGPQVIRAKQLGKEVRYPLKKSQSYGT